MSAQEHPFFARDVMCLGLFNCRHHHRRALVHTVFCHHIFEEGRDKRTVGRAGCGNLFRAIALLKHGVRVLRGDI